MFHSPLADQMLEPPIIERSLANSIFYSVKPVSGEMILFRSWLRHSVKPNRITEDRISIAFNVAM